jgi:hypothetical protein
VECRRDGTSAGETQWEYRVIGDAEGLRRSLENGGLFDEEA